MSLTKVQKQWVKALRSGKYKQGRMQLKRTYGRSQQRYCCMGVLCELAVKAKVIESYVATDSDLPTVVQRWAGLTSTDGHFDVGAITQSLTDWNDRGKRFSAIADFIESEPKGLFVPAEASHAS